MAARRHRWSLDSLQGILEVRRRRVHPSAHVALEPYAYRGEAVPKRCGLAQGEFPQPQARLARHV
jgi:hypothetical protein